jgi:hypothetical protein
MKPRYYRIITRTFAPLGNFRSFPTEVGTTVPSFPIRDPRPLVHALPLSMTVEVGIPPMEPANDSTLATEYLPESPADPAEPQE